MQADLRVDRLKLHELRILLAVAHAGSMSRAATQLAISEPAISSSLLKNLPRAKGW